MKILLEHTRARSRSRDVEVELEGEPVTVGGLAGRPDGRYKVRIEPTKYHSETVLVEVVPGQTVEVEVRLRPRGGEDAGSRQPGSSPPRRGERLLDADFQAATGLTFSRRLAAYLEARGLRTLEDLRRSGGLEGLEGAPDDPALRALMAHARLSVLSPDLELNARLVGKGYDGISAIARTPRDRFLDDMALEEPGEEGTEGLSTAQAAALHVKASAQQRYLQNLVTWQRAEVANGRESLLDELLAEEKTCQGRDCDSAVSPLAYLTELLQYALQHVRKNGAKLKLDDLVARFHQPLDRLPVSCEEVEKPVRQVRLCIEVLREYLRSVHKKALPAGLGETAGEAVARAVDAARLQAYEALLVQIGTSYQELRLSRSLSPEETQRLAGRLGIEADRLPGLLIDPHAEGAGAALEELFGFREPDLPASFSISADSLPRFAAWQREGLQSRWREQDWPTDAYREGQEDQLPVIDPDLLGPDDIREPSERSPAFSLWLQRRRWVDEQLEEMAQCPSLVARWERMGESYRYREEELPPAWPTFESLQNLRRNLLEPPSAKASIEAGAILGVSEGLPVEAFLQQMELLDTWSGGEGGEGGEGAEAIPSREETLLLNLKSKLTGSNRQDAEDAAAMLWSLYHLPPEAFLRMMEIRQLAAAGAGSGESALSAETWRELDSILVQVRKRCAFRLWCRQESLGGQPGEALMSGRRFWISLREPRPGEWPPVMPPGQAWVDPTFIDEADLPGSAVGRTARELWAARRAALDARAQAHEGLSWPDLLEMELPEIFFEYWRESEYEGFLEASGLTREEYAYLSGLKEERDLLPEDKDRAEALLLRVWKHRAGWAGQEGAKPYWTLRKACLPPWRGSREDRRRWQQAFLRRCEPPVIDPDLIDTADLLHPNSSSDAAARIWSSRKQALDEDLEYHRTVLQGESSKSSRLDQWIRAYVGVDSEEFSELAEGLEGAGDLSARLEQLTLSADAFRRLVQLRRLVDAGAELKADEWDEVVSILLQVKKRRGFSQWRQEERESGIVLGPEHFRLPRASFWEVPAPGPRELPPFRATWRARRDWQDRLEARLQQWETVTDALAAAVSATEEITLPPLRDALVLACPDGALFVSRSGLEVGTLDRGLTLETKGALLADRLLLDCRAGGCQQTTRVAQAISSLQTLLLSLRNGRLRQAHEDLSLEAEGFDEQWKWIGSYETWRAATFVHLYPENLLLPELRREQSPAFEKLIQELRRNRRLTPEDALEAVIEFEDYVHDISNLTLETAVSARVGDENRVYVFARGPAPANRIYMCWYEADDPDSKQSFWYEVPNLENVIDVVGAVVYARTPEKRHIYLFLRKRRVEEQELIFTTFDLREASWSDDAWVLHDSLELPEGVEEITAVVKQRTDEGEPPELAVRVSTIDTFGEVSYPRGTVYLRPFDSAGGGWADTTWSACLVHEMAFVDELLAVMSRDGGGFLLIWRQRTHGYSKGKGIHCNLFREDGKLEGTLLCNLKPLIEGDCALVEAALSPSHGPGGLDIFHNIVAEGGGETFRVTTVDLESWKNGEGAQADFEGWAMAKFVAVPCCPAGKRSFAYQASAWPGLSDSRGSRATPVIHRSVLSSDFEPDGSLPLTPSLAGASVRRGKKEVEQLVGIHHRASARSRFSAEVFFQVPIYVALQLHRRRHFQAALDWYRRVYDFTALPKEAIVYPGLEHRPRGEGFGAAKEQNDDRGLNYQKRQEWLEDPLNPHAIAASRSWGLTYSRFTLLSIVRCLLDYADAEFTLDTAESLPRARALYQDALELLSRPELDQRLDECAEILVTIREKLREHAPDPQYRGAVDDLVATLGRAPGPKALEAAGKEALSVFPEAPTQATRELLVDAAQQLEEEVARWYRDLPKDPRDILGLGSHRKDEAALGLLAQEALAFGVEEVGLQAEARFEHLLEQVMQGNPEVDVVPAIAMADRRMGASAQPPDLVFPFWVPPNPVPQALRLYAHLQLFKLRHCRNIAGMEREVPFYAAPTDTDSGMPVIGAGGQLVLSGTAAAPATPYRYEALLERARQLADRAGQMEAAFLSALEKRDMESLRRLEARQEVQLSKARVRLQDLRVDEAKGGVELAELQRDRAQMQADHYQQLITAGRSGNEEKMLKYMHASVIAHSINAGNQLAAAIALAIVAGTTSSPAAGQAAAGYLQ
ncbi:MAG: neuraminidase-like domain-containing protein, partial [Acidobacteriota bacterium]|nr:neuraminidase-like domain-containing protein [Acidobacteriota bacterium]